MRIYGPYLRKDNRKHIVIVHDDGRKQTKSYPKYLLEQKLGRELLPHETCDHEDNDFTNDDINNLQLLTRQENASKEMQRDHRQAPVVNIVCESCSVSFSIVKRIVDRNMRESKAGPFCSKRCAGIYGANIQNGKDFIHFF